MPFAIFDLRSIEHVVRNTKRPARHGASIGVVLKEASAISREWAEPVSLDQRAAASQLDEQLFWKCVPRYCLLNERMPGSNFVSLKN